MSKGLHKRNIHNIDYDFNALFKSEQSLKEYVFTNKYDNLSIDFSNPKAVISLNKALLSHFYHIKNWSIPNDYLCPPIPGRADYIHYIADLLAKGNNNKVPKGKEVLGIDIGVGANAIYSILGSTIYNWNFVASDIDKISIENVNKIINSNTVLQDKIKCKIQNDKNLMFDSIIEKDDRFDFTMCNPPFHKSQKEALKGSTRKVQNLTKSIVKDPTLNFQGQSGELWCNGGEMLFIKKMIKESVKFKDNCLWFTTLVSKKENLDNIYKVLKFVKVFEHQTIDMNQGNKKTRIVAWTFQDKNQQENWRK
ncbi:MAG: 23S rRNA (adenine(1618)-N(6))-methyltransferase RlmF [Campylobacteraceae bacterium]|jgi:23S rRNA (adenine1618-N6)-methyltransferase|nr:23S rRNA (adenine(1618)-N(6))-methyltransferase RlmF [Campylobacteraceae bacterium]MBT4030516.1 23S rRNA (adenine(1618)-N(6))-methyltransferase RlmF [Campylobacteraceae bacterium]MBT4573103.1 23S rRNA (adenine(1618)-N(6))-methyltransferase RlmF [Campylobacteraceae bacterium]MBT7273553.1 23S rRNA (adenine(1618)-N(6))-methyltransferase RlmF [Campylobacteraceae bacterium]